MQNLNHGGQMTYITSFEGSHIDSLTTTYGFHQLILDPTHLLPNSSSCIDLIFTDQQNLAADSGVHPTLHGNCHHQIIFSKFNLMIEYPPPYQQLVWDYKKANTDSIQKALKQINWKFLLSNRSVHQQVDILNNTLMNVFSNFIPKKLVTFNDKDPPWMTEYLKKKIKWHNKIYAEYLNGQNKSVDYIMLQNVIAEVAELVCKSKDNYHKQLARKLTNPKTSSKTYWSILKTFYNGRKVPLIPPLLINNLEADFKKESRSLQQLFCFKMYTIKK